jgi:hypothetical protein
MKVVVVSMRQTIPPPGTLATWNLRNLRKHR